MNRRTKAILSVVAVAILLTSSLILITSSNDNSSGTAGNPDYNPVTYHVNGGVTHDRNGNPGGRGTITITYNGIPSSEYNPEYWFGYADLLWNDGNWTGPNTTSDADDHEFTIELTVTSTSTRTLTAPTGFVFTTDASGTPQSESSSITITGSNKAQTIEVGMKYKGESGQITKVFGGWNTQADGNGDAYLPGDVLPSGYYKATDSEVAQYAYVDGEYQTWGGTKLYVYRSVDHLYATWIVPDIFMKDTINLDNGETMDYSTSWIVEYDGTDTVSYSGKNVYVNKVDASSAFDLSGYTDVFAHGRNATSMYGTIYKFKIEGNTTPGNENYMKYRMVLLDKGSDNYLRLPTGTYRSLNDGDNKAILVLRGTDSANDSCTLSGDVIIDNIGLYCPSIASKNGVGTGSAIYGGGHILIMGTNITNDTLGVDPTGTEIDPFAVIFSNKSQGTNIIQLFGGYSETNKFNGEDNVNGNKLTGILRRDIVMPSGNGSTVTVDAATCLIVHSGVYQNIVGGNCTGDIGNTGSDNYRSTYMVLRGGIAVDSITGSISNKSKLFGGPESTTVDDVSAYGGPYIENNTKTTTNIGGTFMYLLGNFFTTGDTWEDKETGYWTQSNGYYFNETRHRFITNVSSMVTAGSVKGGAIAGSTHAFISGNASVWDVNAASREIGNSTNNGYIEVSGNATVRHMAAGTAANAYKEGYSYAQTYQPVYSTEIHVRGNAKVASIYGAGYDIWADPLGRSLTRGLIDVEVTGNATVGNVYGGGYRGSIGKPGESDKTQTVQVYVLIKGGTIAGDVYGGGSGGLDLAKHALDGKKWNNGGQGDSLNMISNGKSYVYGYIDIKITGGVVMGSVYGGGMSVPVLDKYEYLGGNTLTKFNTAAGSEKEFYDKDDDKYLNATATVIGSTKVEVTGGTVNGSVYGGGKGINLTTIDGVTSVVGDYSRINVMMSDGTFSSIPWYADGVPTYMVDGPLAEQYHRYARVTSDIDRDGSADDEATAVIITGGEIKGSVFGGGSNGSVEGRRYVNIAYTTVNVNNVVRGSVYGSSSKGRDKYNSFVIIAQGDIGGSVFGGGFMGVTENDVYVYIGYTMDEQTMAPVYQTEVEPEPIINIGGSVFSGSDVEEGSTIPYLNALVNGRGEVHVYGRNSSVEIAGGISGDGNSCLTAGYKKIFIEYYWPESKLLGIHRADEAVITASNITVAGREARVYNSWSDVRTDVYTHLTTATISEIKGNDHLRYWDGNKYDNAYRANIYFSANGKNYSRANDAQITVDNMDAGKLYYYIASADIYLQFHDLYKYNDGWVEATNDSNIIDNGVNLYYRVYKVPTPAQLEAGDGLYHYSGGHYTEATPAEIEEGTDIYYCDGEYISTDHTAVYYHDVGDYRVATPAQLNAGNNLYEEGMTQLTKMSSLFRITELTLRAGTHLEMENPAEDVRSYKSLNKEGYPTTLATPSNVITFTAGSSFYVREESTSVIGQYGNITGYTAMEIKDENTYGAYALGSITSTGGFVVQKNGNYVNADTTDFDGGIRCWFISGTESKVVTMSLPYVGEGTTSRTMTSVDLMKLQRASEMIYTGGEFTTTSADYDFGRPGLCSGNDFGLMFGYKYESGSTLVAATNHYVGVTDIFDVAGTYYLQNGIPASDVITLLENSADCYVYDNGWIPVSGEGHGDYRVYKLVDGQYLPVYYYTGDVNGKKTFRLAVKDDLTQPAFTSEFICLIEAENGTHPITLHTGMVDDGGNPSTSDSSFTPVAGSGVYRLNIQFCGQPSNTTTYVGYVTLYFHEVKYVELSDGNMAEVIVNRLEVRVDMYVIGSTASEEERNVVLYTQHGNGSTDVMLPRSFSDHKVFIEGVWAIDTETKQVVSDSNRITAKGVANASNTYGWMNTYTRTLEFGTQKTEVGTLSGGYAGTLRFSVSNYSTLNEHPGYKIVYTIRDSEDNVKNTTTVYIKVISRDKITVTFYDKDGETTQTEFDYGYVLTESDCPTTSKDFVGWYLDAEFRNRYNFNRELIKDISLYPLYKYTVSFDTNTGIIYTLYVQDDDPEGIMIVQPEDPILAGYEFEGWFRDNGTFTDEWNFATDRVTESVTLYAKWKGADVRLYYYGDANEYTLEYGEKFGNNATRAVVNPPSGMRLYNWWAGRWDCRAIYSNTVLGTDYLDVYSYCYSGGTYRIATAEELTDGTTLYHSYNRYIPFDYAEINYSDDGVNFQLASKEQLEAGENLYREVNGKWMKIIQLSLKHGENAENGRWADVTVGGVNPDYYLRISGYTLVSDGLFIEMFPKLVPEGAKDIKIVMDPEEGIVIGSSEIIVAPYKYEDGRAYYSFTLNGAELEGWALRSWHNSLIPDEGSYNIATNEEMEAGEELYVYYNGQYEQGWMTLEEYLQRFDPQHVFESHLVPLYCYDGENYVDATNVQIKAGTGLYTFDGAQYQAASSDVIDARQALNYRFTTLGPSAGAMRYIVLDMEEDAGLFKISKQFLYVNGNEYLVIDYGDDKPYAKDAQGNYYEIVYEPIWERMEYSLKLPNNVNGTTISSLEYGDTVTWNGGENHVFFNGVERKVLVAGDLRNLTLTPSVGNIDYEVVKYEGGYSYLSLTITDENLDKYESLTITAAGGFSMSVTLVDVPDRYIKEAVSGMRLVFLNGVSYIIEFEDGQVLSLDNATVTAGYTLSIKNVTTYDSGYVKRATISITYNSPSSEKYFGPKALIDNNVQIMVNYVPILGVDMVKDFKSEFTVYYGDRVDIDFIENDGYSFYRWSAAGSCELTPNDEAVSVITVKGNSMVTASDIAKRLLKLNITIDGGHYTAMGVYVRTMDGVRSDAFDKSGDRYTGLVDDEKYQVYILVNDKYYYIGMVDVGSKKTNFDFTDLKPIWLVSEECDTSGEYVLLYEYSLDDFESTYEGDVEAGKVVLIGGGSVTGSSSTSSGVAHLDGNALHVNDAGTTTLTITATLTNFVYDEGSSVSSSFGLSIHKRDVYFISSSDWKYDGDDRDFSDICWVFNQLDGTITIDPNDTQGKHFLLTTSHDAIIGPGSVRNTLTVTPLNGMGHNYNVHIIHGTFTIVRTATSSVTTDVELNSTAWPYEVFLAVEIEGFTPQNDIDTYTVDEIAQMATEYSRTHGGCIIAIMTATGRL